MVSAPPEPVRIDIPMSLPGIPVADLASYPDDLGGSEKLESLMLVGNNPLLLKLVPFSVEGQELGNLYLNTGNPVCLKAEYMSPAGSEIDYWIRPWS